MPDTPRWFYTEYQKKRGLKILDLGCGHNKIQNSTGVDIDENCGADVIHDLNNFPYPFDSNSFDIIYLRNILEHLDDPKKSIEECVRIAKNGGFILILLVHFTNSQTFADWTHLRHSSYRLIPQLVKSIRMNNKVLELSKIKITTRIPFVSIFVNLLPRFWEDYLCFLLTGKNLYYKYSVNIK
ncbi:MAG: methyltransferase domain-containing protein [Candidatus Dadabacteria bacterium]|nr:methyltransferase domain-containing protein [Candidatus Dadabacteria bacterium]